MYPRLESRADLLKMLDEMTESRKKILDRCRRLSAGQLHDPVYPGTWSVLQNLAHLAWAEAFMLAWIHQRPGALRPEDRPPEPPADLASVTTALDEAHAAAIAFLKANPEAVLKEKCQYSRQGEQTVGGVFFHLVEHEIHHRAFITHKLARLESASRERERPEDSIILRSLTSCSRLAKHFLRKSCLVSGQFRGYTIGR